MTEEFRKTHALRQVQAFEQQSRHTDLIGLARHAALPVALNSEFLHLLRINFFLDTKQPLPFAAETDLLFSPLVEEIGEDLFEIRPEIRDVLLKGLVRLYSPRRIREIATLLWQYTCRSFIWAERAGLERAQQLTAVYHLNAEAANQWLADAEKNAERGKQASREWFVAMREELSRREKATAEDGARKKAPLFPRRSEPLTVSQNEKQKVFKLNEKSRPLNYVKNEYEDNGDGTITDHATGLIWQKEGSSDWLNYKNAQKYVKEKNREKFAGYNDWRLPTIDELTSLLEPEKQSNGLFIEQTFGKKQRWCWSSDRRSGGGVWRVDFSYGLVYWYYEDFNGYVRLVRPGQ